MNKQLSDRNSLDKRHSPHPFICISLTSLFRESLKIMSFPCHCDTDVLKWMICCSKESPVSVKSYQISLPPFCYILCSISNLFWHSRKLDKSNPDHVSSNQNLISLNLFNLQVYAMHGLFSEIDLKAKREDWTRLQPRHQHWLCRFKIFAQPLPTMTFQSFNKSSEHSASSYAPVHWSS